MAKLIQIKKLLLLLLLFNVLAEASQVDVEGSLVYMHSDYEGDELSLEKTSISFRETLSDKRGDRLQLFFKLEAEDNFNETHIDQLYAKYKGPMGRWNIALGRSLIPFGLLTDYDSEMLLLETQEKKTIGSKSDDGIKLSGFWKSMDYALLVSPGKWMANDYKERNDKMFSLKISFKGEELEDPKIGFSFLLSDFKGVKKELFSIDFTKYYGPLVSRNEVVFGKQDKDDLLSIFSGIDYSLLPSIDLSVTYTHFEADYEENAAFLGLTYNSPFYGLIFRVGNTHYFKNNIGDNKNEFTIQVYKSYSHYF